MMHNIPSQHFPTPPHLKATSINLFFSPPNSETVGVHFSLLLFKHFILSLRASVRFVFSQKRNKKREKNVFHSLAIKMLFHLDIRDHIMHTIHFSLVPRDSQMHLPAVPLSYVTNSCNMKSMLKARPLLNVSTNGEWVEKVGELQKQKKSAEHCVTAVRRVAKGRAVKGFFSLFSMRCSLWYVKFNVRHQPKAQAIKCDTTRWVGKRE